MVVAYTGLEVVTILTMVVAPCKVLHLSRSMNHMYALEADHKLDSPYPRGMLSDKSCNIKLLAS